MSEEEHKGAVLIVDDEPLSRKSIRRVLKAEKYFIGEASSGAEAVKEAEKTAYDIVLLDVRLPDVSGVELVKPLKKCHPDIVIIIITGFASMEGVIHALNEGVEAFLLKPVRAEELLCTVRRKIEQQRLVSDNRRYQDQLRLDVERRRDLERELEISRQNFHDIVHKSIHGVVVVDGRKIVRFMNRTAEGMLSEYGEISGKTLPFIIRKSRASIIDITSLDHKPGKAEVLVVDTDWQGKPARLLLIYDVTERIRTGEELARSEMQMRQVLARLRNAREEERSRISRQIHDELGQVMTALNMDVSWIKKKLAPDAEDLHAKADEMLDLISDTIKVIQGIAMELRPALLDQLGLEAAIEWTAKEFQRRSGIDIRLQVNDDIKIDQDRATAVFRIFQEALTNIIRHANASRINVRLSASGDNLVLSVKDNGRGITQKEMLDPASLGLAEMQEYCLAFGGTARLKSSPGKGTEVTVKMPLL